ERQFGQPAVARPRGNTPPSHPGCPGFRAPVDPVRAQLSPVQGDSVLHEAMVCPGTASLKPCAAREVDMTSRSPAGFSLLAAVPCLLSMVPGQALAQAISFGAPREFSVGVGPNAVASGDFNGDGAPDLAVADAGTTSTVSVLLGNGDGTFG